MGIMGWMEDRADDYLVKEAENIYTTLCNVANHNNAFAYSFTLKLWDILLSLGDGSNIEYGNEKKHIEVISNFISSKSRHEIEGASEYIRKNLHKGRDGWKENPPEYYATTIVSFWMKVCSIEKKREKHLPLLIKGLRMDMEETFVRLAHLWLYKERSDIP